jgi:sortase A
VSVKIKLYALLSTLFLLGLALFPIFPETQSASVQVESSPSLLGENVEGNQQRIASKGAKAKPAGGGSMSLTVPRLGIENVTVPDGSTQADLDREGLIRREDTGIPGKAGSNTFIVGHALGFVQTERPYIFYKLGQKMQPGDRIVLEKGEKSYVYRVYDLLTVRPQDFWVTHPVGGKEIVSLQSCTLPDFEKRIVVRAERVK